jgi:putative pyruvate formate lyase activating enzyme
MPSDRFIVNGFEPSYLRLSADELAARADAARRELEDCRACPRNCGVDRMAGETKTCHTGRHAIVSSAFPHFGEEDCLRGWNGSGTIFFSWCNLRCVFCQNWDISQQRSGREMTASEIAGLMLALQERGCHNINFVTPEHVAPQVVEAIVEAVPRGLRLPIVYNTSAYDSLRSLSLLDGLVDIYMPDFKFWTEETSLRLAAAKDYPDRARAAIAEMHRQVGPLALDPFGIAKRGVLVRHLVMPGLVEESRAIFRWLATELSPDTFVNIMGQYHPAYRVPDREKLADVNRCPRSSEMSEARQAARDAGLRRFDEHAPRVPPIVAAFGR